MQVHIHTLCFHGCTICCIKSGTECCRRTVALEPLLCCRKNTVVHVQDLHFHSYTKHWYAFGSQLSSTRSDVVIALICRAQPSQFNVWPSLVCFAGMWPVLLFHTRPFSNTMETLFVAISLLLVVALTKVCTKLHCIA